MSGGVQEYAHTQTHTDIHARARVDRHLIQCTNPRVKYVHALAPSGVLFALHSSVNLVCYASK